MNARANFPRPQFVAIETDRLRTLLRIATELRDPRWRLEPWIIDLAETCGLDLSQTATLNPEHME